MRITTRPRPPLAVARRRVLGRVPGRVLGLVLGLILALVLAVSLNAGTKTPRPRTGHPSGPPPRTWQDPAAPDTAEAQAFLATYVRPDGRVSRPDQGNDTVSEGQAYGLLLAQAAGREDLVNLIWRWTRTHLQLPDRLFAYHANAAGQTLSPNPASDADVLIAWALLRYHGPGSPALHHAGRQVTHAVLTHETTIGPGAMPVLTAGPWANGRPATLDPSYWSLPALTGLARLTGQHQWQRLATSAVLLTERLTHNGRLLPPDWAALTADNQLLPVPAPDGSQPAPQYGLDAQRTVVWFAASCDPQARALAARWWPVLQVRTRSRALSLQLNGTVLDPTPATLPLVAAAAAAAATHTTTTEQTSRTLLQMAAQQQHHHPGYYNGAWAALGPTLINTQHPDNC